MNNNRFALLSQAEIEELYARPRFNDEQRQYFFALSEVDYSTINAYRNKKSQLYFILQLGYFRAGGQFYDFQFDEVESDFSYVVATYFESDLVLITGKIARNTSMKQKLDILRLEGYEQWSMTLLPKIEAHTIHLMRYFPKGDDTLRELLCYFEKHKITLPSYRTLQDLFTRCSAEENKRLNEITATLPIKIKQQLDNIIKNDDGISKLSLIRSDQKNFQYTAIKLEVEKVILLEDLYQFSKEFIPALSLAKNAVRYYATLAERYPIHRLRKIKKHQQWLYVICFFYHRYQQLMGNLITSFTVNMASVIADSKAYADTQAMLHGSEVVAQFPKLSAFLKWFAFEKHEPDTKYETLSKEAFAILPQEKFSVLAEFMEGNAFDKESAKWDFFSASSRILSLYFRPILLAVDFEFYKPQGELINLMDILKRHYRNNKNPADIKLSDELGLTINKKYLPYLKSSPTDEHIDPYRLEFYLYKKMYHQLERGRLFCNESVSYCSLDHDLVADEVVDQADKIAEKFGYDKLPIYCDQRLDEALEALTEAWERTNARIASGENNGIKTETIRDETIWSLLYETGDADNKSSFFSSLGSTEIADVFKFIGDRSDLWSAFSHIKYKSRKQRSADGISIIACILSDAFGFGIQKMAGMSDINYNHLRSTAENFIRPETLQAANKILSDFTCALPIFKIWNIVDNLTLADADGQKVETSRHTIQSRYSSKYFGTAKGVSVYTLMANHIPVNAKVIGLNEHESHHLYDLVYNNETNVSIDLVTGDNHSINQLNFIALDVIDVGFIPSIKNIRAEADKLYSADEPENYSGLIMPSAKIKRPLIESQKRGILRVLLSLIMQENTQSVIIRKLSSHKRYSRLRAALWEYNKLFKSTHVLNMIDNMQLRKWVRTARNRTEAYHQLQNVIRKIYSGVFKGRKIADNLMCAESSRLVANVIIAYNAILLNNLYEKLCAKRGEDIAKKIIAKISPVAWSHISFTGKYNFKNRKYDVYFDEVIATLEQQLETML